MSSDNSAKASSDSSSNSDSLSSGMNCTHDLAEREVACADGYCPLCLVEKLQYQEEKAKGLVDLLAWCAEYFRRTGGDPTKIDEALAHYERSEAEGNRQGQEKNDGR